MAVYPRLKMHSLEGNIVQFERCQPPRDRHFRVLIGGEHRATFWRSTYGRIGYQLKAADGGEINPKRRWWGKVTKEDFPEVVRDALVQEAIPTLAAIERINMIRQAEVENREWDEARSKRRAEIKRQVITTALALYINEKHTKDPRGKPPHGIDPHYDLAKELFERYSADDFQGWF